MPVQFPTARIALQFIKNVNWSLAIPVQFPTARVALQFVKNVNISLAMPVQFPTARVVLQFVKNVNISLAMPVQTYGALRVALKSSRLLRHKIYFEIWNFALHFCCQKDLLFSWISINFYLCLFVKSRRPVL
jgi:hypothetical protein